MLSTPRLLLRPFTLSDVAKIYAMSQEAALRRWLPDQVYRDERHAEEVVSALMAFTAKDPEPRRSPYVLGIEQRATAVLIGHIGVSPARGSVEIGYGIEERLHGNGFATEAVTAMAAWAMRELALPELLGIVDRDNSASRRVLEKSGFVQNGELVKTVDGRVHDLVIYVYSRSRA